MIEVSIDRLGDIEIIDKKKEKKHRKAPPSGLV